MKEIRKNTKEKKIKNDRKIEIISKGERNRQR